MSRAILPLLRGNTALQSIHHSSTLSLSSAASSLAPTHSSQRSPSSQSSQNHHDLPSFLAYASHVDLPTTSTTYVGTHYEYTVASALQRLNLSLIRVGGRSDFGIDLIGQWMLPSLPYPLKVIVQCKALNRAPGPNLIREMEGAFAGAPAGWNGTNVLGLLAAPKEATKGVRDALGRSRLPLCYLKVGLEGKLEQCLWNKVAASTGLEGMGVTMKYTPTESPESKDVDREVVLTWKGNILTPVEVDKQCSAI
ncbi:MAG: hypothetical protein M1827_005203 [Pycnora praestabilis]|nr:MAG: hypothetical protein M1827_005203 [Pycnora praestabilis]